MPRGFRTSGDMSSNEIRQMHSLRRGWKQQLLNYSLDTPNKVHVILMYSLNTPGDPKGPCIWNPTNNPRDSGSFGFSEGVPRSSSM